MSKVEPIRNKEDIYRIEDMLFKMGTAKGDRMFVMFELGILLGLRIGDLLKLKVGDIRGKQSYVFYPEKQDTHKGKENYKPKQLSLTIAPELRNMVNNMYAGVADDEYLLRSNREGPDGKLDHIDRQTAWRDMKQISRMSGLQYPIGCHTLRKTFGYHVYMKFHDVAWLQGWFMHSSAAVTLIYIGIADDEKKHVTDNMPFEHRGRFDYRSKRNNLQ